MAFRRPSRRLPNSASPTPWPAGPLTADELGRRVGADPDAVARLMRLLISRGIFRRRSGDRFALNALGDTLRSDAPVSMAGAALFYGSKQHREHWTALVESVRTGKASVPAIRGMEFFEYLTEDPSSPVCSMTP